MNYIPLHEPVYKYELHLLQGSVYDQELNLSHGPASKYELHLLQGSVSELELNLSHGAEYLKLAQHVLHV